MATQQPEYIQDWPEESREAAKLVIDKYGKPDEITETCLIWHKPGPWKRIVALNLMHDIVRGEKTVQEARDYYAKEFLDYRRKKPTPYMEKLRFTPGDGNAADPDVRVLSKEDLEHASRQGEK